MSDSLYSFLPSDLERIAAESFVGTVHFHQQLRSTSDRALELAATLDALEAPLLVLTESQTAGRGRRNNRWWSGPGALTFSLVIDTDSINLPRARGPQLSLATALAVSAAMRQCDPVGQFRLKWPNDVYLGTHKIAGILLERSAPRPERLVIGIGINVNNSLANAPEKIQAMATSLADTRGRAYSLSDVLMAVLDHIAAYYRLSAAGNLQLAERWRPHCLLRDRMVRVAVGKQRWQGVCRGIDEDGALVIETEACLTRLFAGVIECVD